MSYQSTYNSQKDAINTAINTFKGIKISEDSKINDTIRSLRSEGISSFAIREGLKTNGLLEFEDDE